MDSKDRLEFALSATGAGMWTVGGDDRHFECDDRTRSLWGLRPDDPIALETFLSAMDAKPAETIRRLVMTRNEPWPGTDIEVRITRLDDGTERWIALRGTSASGKGGHDVVGTVRDVTDARRYDAQVHLLMREVTHRSKNLLAIIQAMARRTVKTSLTASDFEQRFSGRLRGLAFSHEILASQDWRGASMRDLVSGHLSHLMEQFVGRVSLAGPVMFIRPEAAQNIGLALHELSTNAASFGALSGSQGEVSFEWTVEADERGPRALRFTWRETGQARAVAAPARRGFGHEVMERVVARALDGAVETRYPQTGFEWTLRIPVSHIATETLEEGARTA